MSNNDEIISKASPHTIKKFELIEKYVEAWAQKLLRNDYCKGLVFIDCMCNSGEYVDEYNQQVFGTPVRISKILRDAAGQFPNKQFNLYFNDFSSAKIAHLKSLVGSNKQNFSINITCQDGNALLKNMRESIFANTNIPYLLVYDPYDATIDWDAIMPFLNNWGEVIINHSLMDSTRAVKMAKSKTAINKYEQTYQMGIDDLSTYGSDKEAYEVRIIEIIESLRKNQKKDYYIAAAPFFNKRNAIAYDLLHCTGNIAGFKLYKKSAWQTFGGKSSTKDTHGGEDQYVLDFNGKNLTTLDTDEDCYYIKDVAKYLQSVFSGQQDVPLETIWNHLDNHPIFPSDCFRKEIKNELKQLYNAKISRSSISFSTEISYP